MTHQFDGDSLEDLPNDLGSESGADAGAGKFRPAWGGRREQGSVPVPLKFDGVTGLGPAVAVYGLSRDVLIAGPGATRTLVLYRDGFAYQKAWSKKVYLWRWDEVAAIVSHTRMYSSGRGSVHWDYAYTLMKGGGEKLVLTDNLEQVDQLIQPIKRNVFALLWPPLSRQYNAGQAVAFGPVAVHSQNGIRTGGRAYAWADIMDIKVERGRLTITTRDSKRHEVRASAIPNVELLCRLIGVELSPEQLTYY